MNIPISYCILIAVVAVGATFGLCSIRAQKRQLEQCQTCDALRRAFAEPDEEMEAVAEVRPKIAARLGIRIDIERLIQAESLGRPDAVSPAGARGPAQMMKQTFIECARALGHADDWQWPADAHDPGVARMAANHYVNTQIPRMLRHYDVPDNVTTRLAAYNWGIGNITRWWKRQGPLPGHELGLPAETRSLIRRYNGTARTKGRKDTKDL